MIEALGRTLVAVRDLKEQGESTYILVAGAGGTRYYAVDNYEVGGDIVEFYKGEECVFVTRVDSSWSLVRRDAIDLVSEEEVLRSSKTDHDALEKLHGELHPSEVVNPSERIPGGNYI